jgi:RNA polymerase sigma-70 factor (ECF subfamily)
VCRDTTLLIGAYVTSDEQLILEIRQGSRAAFETLFDRYRQPVWQFFRRRTRRAEVAEELAQDTFVAVLEGAARYEQRGMFRSYLFGIAYNVLLADRRKAARRATDPLDVEPANPESFDPDAGIWVRNALARLDEDDREILMLREYEQLSYQEIADLRGTPLNTVRSHLFRARMALKSALETRAPQAVRTTHGGR